MNTKSLIIGVVIGAVVFGGGGFYFGTKHAANATGARQFTGAFRLGMGEPGGAGGRAGGGGFVAGEILAKDATSVTIKMQNGSTKIVLLGESSQVTKSAEGSVADLSIGTNVLVTGGENADGSMTAQTVQIRPAGQSLQVGAPSGVRTTQ